MNYPNNANRYFLKNGLSFIQNPDLEPSPDEARQEKIKTITSINPHDLKNPKIFGKAELRAVATGLVSLRAADGKKYLINKELAEKIAQYITELRRTRQLEIELFLRESNISADLVESVWEGIQNQDLTNEQLSSYIVNGLKTNHRTETSLVKTGIPRLFHGLEESPLFLAHKSRVEAVKAQVRQDTRDVMDRVNNNYKAKVSNSNHKLIEIDGSVIESFCKTVAAEPTKYNWKHWVYVVGFCTGRRMAEILGNHSEFKATDAGITFKGLLKTKGTIDEYGNLRSEIAHPLTLLHITPEQLVELDEMISDYKIPPDEVNKKRAKALSKGERPRLVTKVLWDAFPNRDENGKLEASFKDTRTYYATVMQERYRQEKPNCTELVYVGEKLLHDDVTTTLSYQKYRLR